MIQKPDKKFEVKGIIEIDEETSTIHIKELPIGRWIKDHKEFLDSLIEKDDRIIGFREYHTKNRVHFQI